MTDLDKKRRRENPTKKWTEEENLKILDYVLRNRNFERPTAQMYYHKLLKETKIDATWVLVKCKMRYFRKKFVKANTWCKGFGISKADEAWSADMLEQLLWICPHYEQLLEIFGNNSEMDEINGQSFQITMEEESSSQAAMSNRNSPECEGEDTMYEMFSSEDIKPTLTLDPLMTTTTTPATTTASYLAPPLTQAPTKEKPTLADHLKSWNPKAASIDELVALKRSREEFNSNKLKLENEKLQFEKEKLNRDYEIQEKRLRLEEDRQNREFRLREMEMEQKERLMKYELEHKERLVKYEMEQKERLLKYEIDAKYKNNDLIK